MKKINPHNTKVSPFVDLITLFNNPLGGEEEERRRGGREERSRGAGEEEWRSGEEEEKERR